MRIVVIDFFYTLLLLIGCKDSASPVASGALDEDLEALRKKEGVVGLNVGLIQNKTLVHTGAYGMADVEAGIASKPDTIFALASVSKVFVGLAAARAIELGFPLDLDADVNDVLDWNQPLEHPDFPDTAVTLRQLMRHEAGIVADGPGDYEEYPKPDPSSDLDTYLETLLANDMYWGPTEPGEAEEYSNLGTALAALVIQKIVGQDFAAFCEQEVFGPLQMRSTHWFYRDYSAADRARIARPHDEDGQPYEHYGFDDWPSGQLRSTVGDLARALIVLGAGGKMGGKTFLSPAQLALFETTPLLIAPDKEAEPDRYGHSGGESGVNTYIEYDKAGNGLIVLINQDLPDEEETTTLLETAEERLREEID